MTQDPAHLSMLEVQIHPKDANHSGGQAQSSDAGGQKDVNCDEPVAVLVKTSVDQILGVLDVFFKGLVGKW